MTIQQGAPQRYWLIQDSRGAPTWIYIAPVYETGHQFMQTQNQETALKFLTQVTCLNFINLNKQLQVEWMPVQYIRYTADHWVRVGQNEST